MLMVMMRAVAVCTLLLGSVQGASPCLAPTARPGSLSLRGGRPSQPPDVACLEERIDEWLLQWLKGIEAAVASTTTTTKEPTHAATPPGAIGAVRDSRGCLTSAGYAWCESAGACTPVWELCPSVGAPISPTPATTTTGADATATAGAGGPLLGEVVDEFGCRASAGFRWCDSAAACTPSWQECVKSPTTTTATAVGGGDPGRVVLQRAAKPTDMYKDADVAVKPGTPDTGAAPRDPNGGAGGAVPPPTRRRSLFGKATDMYKDAANAKADDDAGTDHGPGGAAAVVPRRLRAAALGKPTDQYKGVAAGVPANNAVAPARRLGLVSAAATAVKPADQYKDVAAAEGASGAGASPGGHPTNGPVQAGSAAR